MLALFLVCFGMLAGQAQSDQPVSITLTGVVRFVSDAGATPWLGDATVVLSSAAGSPGPIDPAHVIATAAIDSTGHFIFYDLKLNPGTYRISATIEQYGFENSATFVVAPSDDNRTIDTTIDVSQIVTRGVGPQGTDPFVTVPVFFATDRKQGPSDPVGASFLDEPAVPGPTSNGPLAYGVAKVTIPKLHQRGEVEGPDTELNFLADKANNIILTSVTVSPEGTFYHDLRANLDATKAQNPKRRVIVYIHGYKSGFNHSLRVAAQIKYDLKPVETTVILYSWPSRDAYTGYFDDQTFSTNTADALKSFLLKTAAQSGGAEVSVIAHSMGNSALLLALQKLAADATVRRPVLDKIIMAAPDVPAADVANNSCRLSALATGMTLYASNHDQALLAAAAISKAQALLGVRHEDPARAGLENPLLVALGLDTVDASSAVTDFLGHGYFSHDVNILTDIEDVLNGEPPPRSDLIAKQVEARNYWLFTGKRPSPDQVNRVAIPRCPAAAR
jgi:esterase/lipase superfamily enzyme